MRLLVRSEIPVDERGAERQRSPEDISSVKIVFIRGSNGSADTRGEKAAIASPIQSSMSGRRMFIIALEGKV